jgi:glycosyltransferase involved in cell wall biosynthesis
MTTPGPRLTIAVPTLRRLAYLREAVQSALDQRNCAIEVLVSQDLLPDGTLDADVASWSAAAARQDPRVRYLASGRRLGLAGNWNRVAAEARGEFLTVIGDDDRLVPEFGATLLAHAAEADIVFANHYLIDAEGTRLAPATEHATRRFGRDVLAAGPQLPAAACVWRNAVPMSASMVRAATARRLRFAEHLNTPDVEFFARAAAEGARLYFRPEYLAEYRVHPQSATMGGLTMAELVAALEPIPVPPAVESLKASLLGEFADAAFRDGLKSGDFGRLRGSPAWRRGRSAVTRLLSRAGDVPLVGALVLASASWAYRATR